MAKVYRPKGGSQSVTPKRLRVSVRNQELALERGGKVLRRYPISTSQFGIGSEEGSMKTPLGRFRIAEKIGAETPAGTVFKERQPIAETAADLSDEDLVMSRILWLDGVEDHNANTFQRYIYIHGTNHEEDIGTPASHGCVRMRNADMVELFEQVNIDTPVLIEE